MKLHLPTKSVWPILLLWTLAAASAEAVPVSRLEVRVVTGAAELTAGSSLELRIYEAGKSVRRLPLVHGEAWPRDSTHIIPVKLSDALDPRNVDALNGQGRLFLNEERATEALARFDTALQIDQ